MNPCDDNEELDDFIRLNFTDLPKSQNLQLLDPGIIDLECDSEDDCTIIPQEQKIFHGQPDHLSQLVTTSHFNKVRLKPMSIKVVDCFKFPWYFNKFKNIIEDKLVIKNTDNSSTDPLMEVNNLKIKSVDRTQCVDMSVHTESMRRQSYYDCRNEIAQLNKEIDIIAVKEFSEARKPIDGVKRVIRNKKMDLDIRKAMEQRKNTVVDLKRNIGLVGMKILRLPNTTPSRLPIEISVSKRLKDPMEGNREKEQGNKEEKGPTESLHMKAIDKALMNVGTSMSPVFEKTVEEMKDTTILGTLPTQNIVESSCTEPSNRSVSTLVETEIYSGDAQLRCNLENNISMNKKTEEIDNLVRLHKYAGKIRKNNPVVDSCNSITTLMKFNEEKRSNETFQNYISEGNKTTKMIDPMPFPLKKRNKDQIKTHLQSKASEIIEIYNKMSTKTENTVTSSTESNIISKNKRNHINAKEISSKNKQSSNKTKPKVFLSTKKPNKLTETIIKIKEKQLKQSSLSEATKSQKPCSIKTSSSTLSKSKRENGSLQKKLDTGYDIIAKTQEQLLNENDEVINIKSLSPRISIAQLQYTNRDDFETASKNYNHTQNTMKNKVSIHSNVVVIKTPGKEGDAQYMNSKYAKTITESSVAVKCDESNTTLLYNTSQSTKKTTVDKIKLMDSLTKEEQLKPHPDTNQILAVNTIETASKNYPIPTIVNYRDKSISCTKFDTMSDHNTNVSMPPDIVKTTPNQLQATTEPLTVYNSMQAHTLYKPPPCSYRPIQQSQYTTMRFPLHLQQMNQPIHSNTGHSLQNSTQYSTEILPQNEIRQPTADGVNEKNSPMFHRLPMPTFEPIIFGAPMMNGITPNMPILMGYPRPNGGFGPQMPSNPRLMSPSGVSSENSSPTGTISSQMPMNYGQIPFGESGNQSHEVIWSGAFSSMPPPPPPPLPPLPPLPPPPPYLPASLDISTSLSTLVPQSKDSSIIGRNINGIVKKINITAPVIDQKEEIESKAGIIKLENSESDLSTLLYNEVPTAYFDNTESINTKKEMLKELNTGLSQKKANQRKTNHYLMNFIRKQKEKKGKKIVIPPNQCNESIRNRAEKEISGYGSSNVKKFGNHSSCVPEKTKILNSKKNNFIQYSKKERNRKKLSDKSSKTSFDELFGDDTDNARSEKVANDNKITDKCQFVPVNHGKRSEKNNGSFVNLKRPIPASNKKPALSPKYRPGPLSKKRKLNDQDRVTPHQINKKQILQTKSYSDPILPIPTYEKVLSDMPSYLCYRDDMKKSFDNVKSRSTKTSGDAACPIIPNPKNKIIEKEKEKQRPDKVKSIKKISIDDYKMRFTSDRRADHVAKDNNKKHVEKHRRLSNVDSDLGYDSDSTVKL